MEADGQVAVAAGVGLVLYVGTFWATMVVFVWWVSKKEECCPAITIERVFFFFLFVFLALRSFWVVLRVFGNGEDPEFVVNRVAGLAFLTVFTSILFAWVEEIHSGSFSARADYTRFLTKAAWGYLLLNLLVWAFQIVVIGILVAEPLRQRSDDPLLLANTLTMVSIYLLLALAFLLYGFRLYQLKSGNDIDSISHTREQLLRILLASLGFGLCFALRVVVFLWAPISGNYIGPSLFLTLGYIVPEVLPCWIALLIALGYGKNPDAIDFVQTLYGDERLLSSRERAPRSASPSAPPLHHRRKLKINNDSESEGALVSGDSVQDAYGYRSNDDDPPSELSRASSPEGFFPAEPFIDTLPLMLDSSSSYQSPPPSSLHYHSDLSNALGGYRYESLHHAPDLRSYGSVGTASSLLPPPPSSFSAATVSDSHAPRPGSLLERLSSQMKQYHA